MEKNRVEVLVTTMYQSDLSKYYEMNLQTDAVIANQTDANFYMESKVKKNTVKMMSTDTRGLSRNRNIALSLSKGEYILFADDDMRLIDNYQSIVLKEFRNHPEAEAIKFWVEAADNSRALAWKRPSRFKKASRSNLSSSGVVAIVIKEKILKAKNIYFNESFGSGTDNYCGEDTIFLQELINKGVKVYISPTKISEIVQRESTWFQSYDDKYFIVKGKVLGTIYPKLAYFIVIRSAYRFTKRKECKMCFWHILRCYYNGIRSNK